MVAPGDEEGSGTVLVLAVCGALLVALAATGVLLTVVAARHRAQAAADLAALAAADALLGRRAGPACDEAADAAAVNAAVLELCDVSDGVSAIVRVSVMPSGAAGVVGPASATARAGPAVPGPGLPGPGLPGPGLPGQ